MDKSAHNGIQQGQEDAHLSRSLTAIQQRQEDNNNNRYQQIARCRIRINAATRRGETTARHVWIQNTNQQTSKLRNSQTGSPGSAIPMPSMQTSATKLLCSDRPHSSLFVHVRYVCMLCMLSLKINYISLNSTPDAYTWRSRYS